jgi:hypothetical protein
MGNTNFPTVCNFNKISYDTQLPTRSNNMKPSNTKVFIHNSFLLPDKASGHSHKSYLSDQRSIHKNCKDKKKFCKFSVYHQNVRGLRHKLDELLLSLSPNLPQVLCITEHHLTNAELDGLLIPQYDLGGNFCRKLYRCGGVCIFIRENIAFTKLDCDKITKEKDLEICAVKVHLSTANMVIICIYRSPAGDFHYFLTNLEMFLNSIFSNTNDIIICGDFNINYIQENKKKTTIAFLTCFLQFI